MIFKVAYDISVLLGSFFVANGIVRLYERIKRRRDA